MAKKVIVGGRIESKEVGGIVTGAAEILDDAKGKKQSIINQETDAELLRLDGAKQDNLTFDNVPTEGSNNPVKSGGLYTAQQAILLAIAAINELIPSAASALNQLADKAFVNSSISTNTATFRGTSAAGLNEQQFLAWANGLEHDLNDYVFWQTSDAAGNTLFKRYKWNGTEWAYEYTLNNSTFTAEQWEAIQSGITALLVAKLRALPTAQDLIQSFDGKQDVLTFDDTPTLGSNNPVKSSGIYNVIKAITDLIPAEATAQNQLADKADVAAKIVAAIPSWKGQYDALTDLQAVTGAKAGDMGCVKTTDSDGHAVLTFYQYSAQGAWVEYYTLRHYAQNKPATTGTTGDYPYNGMGRIELQKNIVNGVNTLTQAMLTQQNTIYVIQYDFTLSSNVTIPANCVLEFDGGSLSGAYTITGANTGINAGLVKIFGTDVTLAGTWNIAEAPISWFGADINNTDNATQMKKALDFGYLSGATVYIPEGTYKISSSITLSYTTSDPAASPDTDVINVRGGNNSILLAYGSIENMFVFYECSVKIVFDNLHLHGNSKEVKLINMVETANNIQAQFVANNCRFTHVEGANSACIYSFHGYVHLTECTIQGTGTGGGIGVMARTTDICLDKCKFAYLIKAIDFNGMAEGTVSAYSCWFQVCFNNIYYEKGSNVSEPSTFVNCYFVESREFTNHIGFDDSGAHCFIGSLVFLNCMFDGGQDGYLINLRGNQLYGFFTVIGCKRWSNNIPNRIKVADGITTKIENSDLTLASTDNTKHVKFLDWNGGAGTGNRMASVVGDNIRHCNYPQTEGVGWFNTFGVNSITQNGLLLPAGVYKIRCASFCYGGGNNRLFLKDANNNLLLAGISDYAAPETIINGTTIPGGSCLAEIDDKLVLPEQTEIILHHNIEIANADGLGHGGSRSADISVDFFAYIDVEKVG